MHMNNNYQQSILVIKTLVIDFEFYMRMHFQKSKKHTVATINSVWENSPKNQTS